MMIDPDEKSSQQDQDFEWANVEGKIVKITNLNSNGRKCEGCGCSCPCKCDCCKPICCSAKQMKKEKKNEN